MTVLPAPTMQRAPLLAAAALLGATMLFMPPIALAGCKPNCATGSVVNAAGIPPKVTSLVAEISFEGNTLSAKGRSAVRNLAVEIKAAGLKDAVKIVVPLEEGATGKTALQQAQARAKAVGTALAQQGLKPGAYEVTAGK
jgi:hypothetical protein